MRILQITSIQGPAVTARLIRATRGPAAIVALDLEDSLWDVLDETRTSALKGAVRENLVGLADVQPELFSARRIGVRINRIAGSDAALDFEALGRASRRVEFECVIPTKVESGADIHENLARLREAGVAYRAIIPIVETCRGMANLDEILEAARRAGIQWIIYGHFDFALDSHWWPFPEPHEPRFWEVVTPLIRRWVAAGIGYVQPPYFDTHDRSGLATVVNRLGRTCTREFGILTLGPRQTEAVGRMSGRLFSADEAGGTAGLPATIAPPDRTPEEYARHVVGTFVATRRRHSAGWALEPRSGEFISPHVYLAARDYLRRVGDG
jgi:citrate lyase beta subunit